LLALRSGFHDDKGIVYYLTIPKHPQQNNVAGKWNRMLFEMVGLMIVQTKIVCLIQKRRSFCYNLWSWPCAC